MKLKDIIKCVTSGVPSLKSVEQRIEEQNTRTVWFPRVWGFPRKYVYGKRPGEPLKHPEWHPDGPQYPKCASESSPELIERHIAICRGTDGSHGGLCEMCKKLNNPNRMDLLIRLYRNAKRPTFAGLNVNDAQDGSKIFQPATSEYLRQLWGLKLIRRERAGRLVNYYPDFSRACAPVSVIAAMIADRAGADSDDFAFAAIFRVMMGSVRSRIVRFLAAGGIGVVESLCDEFSMRETDLHYTLRPAVDGGILSLDVKCPDGTYRYITPADPIARRIVELS